MDWGEWFSLQRTRDFFQYLAKLRVEELEQLGTMPLDSLASRTQGKYLKLVELSEVTVEDLEEWKKQS